MASDAHPSIRVMKSDFSKGLYLSSYLSLFNCLGIHFSDAGNSISREEYPLGNALIGWDLTEDLEASQDHVSLARQGSLRLDLQFSKALSEAICVIFYAEFDNVIEITKNRNIFIDYSS